MDEQQFRAHVIAALARIETNVVALTGRTADLEREVHGNGQPGLKSHVATLVERTSSPSKVAATGGLGGAVVIAVYIIARLLGVEVPT